MTNADFTQVYNNIFDAVPEAITVGEEPNSQRYKVVTYNNTIVNPTYKGIVRYGCDIDWTFTESEVHKGLDYNNLIDSSDKTGGFWFTGTALNVFAGCSDSRNPYFANPDISNYIGSNNYFYRPDDPDIIKLGTVYYSATEYEAQIETGTQKIAYSNPYDAGNLLFAGTSGANKFITKESHIIEGSTTIANGGIGGAHPYLSGITLPSYIGAVDPNNNGWIVDVLCLTDTDVLKNGKAGGPACSNPPKAIAIFNATVIKK